MKEIRLAVIPGDGIGKETVAAGKNVLDAVAVVHGGFRFRYEQFDWSCEYYAKHGRMMPENGLDLLRPHDAIFLGAVGYPGVPDHISLWGLLIPIRRTFQQYINLRPVKLLPGVRTPLANRGPEDIDFFIVRENNEGEYSNMGGHLYEGQPNEIVVQNTVFTRLGVERVVRYAFELARKTGRKRVTSATKSNGINITMPFWTKFSGPWRRSIRTSRPISSTSTPSSHGSSPTRSISTSWWEATCSATSCPTLAPPSREA